jgi:glycerophosphoryl diester phosphodiesterase
MAASLTGRAVLPAVTFAPGPSSGKLIGPGPFNAIIPPFPDQQPIQGFSGALDRGDGTFEVMADNGFGAKNNSADFHLRVYTVRPNFVTDSGGNADVTVERFVELSDPKRRAGFPIQNENVLGRVLTGADFDIESIQKGRDGSFWIGDEFGPFVLHVAASGELLDAPFPAPGVSERLEPLHPRR